MKRAPLHYAALHDDPIAVADIIRAGADPNVSDIQGFTPMHLAAQEYALSAARVLVAMGAAIDAENAFGNTPMFVAVFNSKGRGELIELLRENGANPFHMNKSAQTPLGLARLISNYDVARYFSDLPS